MNTTIMYSQGSAGRLSLAGVDLAGFSLGGGCFSFVLHACHRPPGTSGKPSMVFLWEWQRHRGLSRTHKAQAQKGQCHRFPLIPSAWEALGLGGDAGAPMKCVGAERAENRGH